MSDLETIQVVYDEGVWWAITGNRRLYLFKKLEEVRKKILNIQVTITVEVKDLSDRKVMVDYRKKKDTESDGESIICRRGKLEDKLTEIIKEYIKDQREFTMSMEQCSVVSLDSDDYSDEDRYPDFTAGSIVRKYPEDK